MYPFQRRLHQILWRQDVLLLDLEDSSLGCILSFLAVEDFTHLWKVSKRFAAVLAASAAGYSGDLKEKSVQHIAQLLLLFPSCHSLKFRGLDWVTHDHLVALLSSSAEGACFRLSREASGIQVLDLRACFNLQDASSLLSRLLQNTGSLDTLKLSARAVYQNLQDLSQGLQLNRTLRHLTLHGDPGAVTPPPLEDLAPMEDVEEFIQALCKTSILEFDCNCE